MELSIDNFAVLVCENFESCDDCPVITQNADKRTKRDRAIGQVTCQTQLANWIREGVLKELKR